MADPGGEKLKYRCLTRSYSPLSGESITVAQIGCGAFDQAAKAQASAAAAAEAAAPALAVGCHAGRDVVAR
ncbi:MAG: hypothetical protein M9951_20485 [Burkholderiaceae bacterium]|nr:hypothetical protein [Burkholderiaceae bacterium]